MQTCWKTTTNVWPLCLPTKVSPPSIKFYCSMDQILISCENMIINIYILYNVVILDFFVIFCLSMLKWLKLYTVPFFVSGQTYKISKGSNNYCSHFNQKIQEICTQYLKKPIFRTKWLLKAKSVFCATSFCTLWRPGGRGVCGSWSTEEQTQENWG